MQAATRRVAGLFAAAIFTVIAAAAADAALAPGALIAPKHQSFGKSVFGVTGAPSAPRNISVVNSRTASAVTGLGVTIGGSNPGDFQIANNGCGGSLAPGASCVVTVVFAPTGLGARSALLTVSDDQNGAAAVVGLIGAGVPGKIGVGPGLLSFGKVRAGTGSAPIPVTLTNPNNVALLIQSISAPPGFVASQSCVGALAANGGTCQVSVTFNPPQVPNPKGTPFRGKLVIVDDAIRGAQSVKLAGIGFGTPPLTITSVSNTSPIPLTPIQISTANLDVNSPVSIQFSDGAGFSATEAPTSVAPDGTISAGVPIYMDASHTITSGAVSIVVSQTNGTSAPASLTIQALPAVASYGTPLGQISHAVLAFSAMALGQRLSELQAFQALPGNTVDTSAAQSALSSLLIAVIEARNDVDRVAVDNTVVISSGNLADGTPVQFDASSLDMMDRVMGVFLSNNFVTPPSALRSNSMAIAPQISAATMTDLIKELTTISNVNAFNAGIVKGAITGNLGDQLEALAGGISLFAETLQDENVAAQLGALGGVLGSARTIGNAFGDDAAFIVGLASGDQNLVDAAVNDMQSVPTLAYAQALAGLFGTFSGLEAIAAPTSMVLGLLDVYQAEIESNGEQNAYDTSLQITGEFPNPFPSNQGIATLTGASNVTNNQGSLSAQSGLDLCCFGAGALDIIAVADPSGNYDTYVPLQVPGTNYSNLTLSLFDPVSDVFLNSETVDLSSLTTSSPGQAPTISGTCNDSDASNPDGDDPDCD